MIDASSSRFRPIMLTAISTVLGMIPIAPTIFWGPMAFAIMGGLLVGDRADADLPAGALRRLVRSQGTHGRDPDAGRRMSGRGRARRMLAGAARLVKWAALLIGVVALTLLGALAWNAQRGRPLELWHTFVPKEMHAEELDKADWAQYLKAEQTLFDEVRAEVTEKLPPKDRVPINRYFEGSPIYPGHFARDWNRSYIMEPDGPPLGAVVLLHGLTDSPYSLRHIAERYRAHGFVVVAIRMPGHGTVPSGLTDIDWQDWSAATRLAVREARRRIGPSLPLQIVGFSNGGALAMQYALDAIETPELTRPSRLVLISPMIGITRFARFAGLTALPALLPAFEKAAWLSVVPEFIPFKYNSFPVNGATQSHRLTVALQAQIDRLARENRLTGLPPILTFQSVIDFTVSTRAIVTALYARLPANGSELVLFDLNRTVKFGPLLRVTFDTTPDRLLPPPPRAYRTTVVTNASAGTGEVIERVTEAGATTEQSHDLGLSYPAGVFSLSHLALPFPMSDSLYGLRPEGEPEFGIELGAMAARGERGALIISPEVADAHDLQPLLLLHDRAESRTASARPRTRRGRTRPSRERRGSKRAEQRAQDDHRDEREDGADDGDHDDVEIALAVRRAADGEQRHDRAVVRQAVERARADHRDAVHQRRIDAGLGREPHVGAAQRVERDRQAARGRAGQRGQHVGRDGQRDQRPAADRQHPVAHHGERRQRRDDGAEAHQARDADRRQHGGVGAGIHALRAAPAGAGRLTRDQRHDRGGERDRHRPHAADRVQRGRAPALLGEERRVEARQNDHRHQEIDADHDDQRQRGERDRRLAWRCGGREGSRPGSNSRAVVARSRTRSSSAAASAADQRRRRSLRRRAAPRPRHASATTGRSPA